MHPVPCMVRIRKQILYARHLLRFRSSYKSDVIIPIPSTGIMGGTIPGRRGLATRMDMDSWTMERPVKFPSDLEILESSTHGRGLFSKRDLGPGTEVLVSQPFVHVVSSSSRGSVCDQCLSGTE